MVCGNFFKNRTAKSNTSINNQITIKQLPVSVKSRLFKLSSDKHEFLKAAFAFQEALKPAEYNNKLGYNNSYKYNEW